MKLTELLSHVPKPTIHRPSTFLSISITLLTPILITSSVVAYVLRQSSTTKNAHSLKDKSTEIPYQQWINCSEIRKVLEYQDKIILGCLGGVLFVNKSDGIVFDQLTTTQGLTSSTVTDMTIVNNMLYIGTQDGITIYSLSDNTAKPLRVSEGLINGSNIVVTNNNETVWIGTFDGIASLEILSNKLENYSASITSWASKMGIKQIITTQNAVYALVSANAYSSGGIIRFDITGKNWSTYSLPDFNTSNRIDFETIITMKNSIIAQTYENTDMVFYSTDDSDPTQWKKMDNLPDELNMSRVIGTINDKVLFSTKNAIKGYSLEKRTMTIYMNTQDYSLIPNQIVTDTNTSLWMKNIKTGALELIDIRTQDRIETVPVFPNRPVAVTSLLAVINDNALIADHKSNLWLLERSGNADPLISDENSLQTSLSELDSITAIAVADTPYLIILSQICGMDCSLPVISRIDFKQRTRELIKIPEKYSKTFSQAPVDIIYSDKSTLLLSTPLYSIKSTEGAQFPYYEIDIHALTITPKENISSNEKQLFMKDRQTGCNKWYTFSQTNNTFDVSLCPQITSDHNGIWSIEGRNIVYTEVDTSNRISIDLIAAEPEYSPFSRSTNNIAIGMLTTFRDSLWVHSDRGLIQITANEKSFSQNLYTTKQGLINNHIANSVITPDSIWAYSTWGGLAYSKR